MTVTKRGKDPGRVEVVAVVQNREVRDGAVRTVRAAIALGKLRENAVDMLRFACDAARARPGPRCRRRG
jgi:hypothetical protein